MAQVELFKKTGTYEDSNGNEKSYVNFYLRCGDSLIPIEPCYFPDPKNENKDFRYSGRKEVLKAFATTLPDKPKSTDNSDTEDGKGPKPKLQSFDDDGDIPF